MYMSDESSTWRKRADTGATPDNEWKDQPFTLAIEDDARVAMKSRVQELIDLANATLAELDGDIFSRSQTLVRQAAKISECLSDTSNFAAHHDVMLEVSNARRKRIELRSKIGRVHMHLLSVAPFLLGATRESLSPTSTTVGLLVDWMQLERTRPLFFILAVHRIFYALKHENTCAHWVSPAVNDLDLLTKSNLFAREYALWCRDQKRDGRDPDDLRFVTMSPENRHTLRERVKKHIRFEKVAPALEIFDTEENEEEEEEKPSFSFGTTTGSNPFQPSGVNPFESALASQGLNSFGSSKPKLASPTRRKIKAKRRSPLKGASGSPPRVFSADIQVYNPDQFATSISFPASPANLPISSLRSAVASRLCYDTSNISLKFKGKTLEDGSTVVQQFRDERGVISIFAELPTSYDHAFKSRGFFNIIIDETLRLSAQMRDIQLKLTPTTSIQLELTEKGIDKMVDWITPRKTGNPGKYPVRVFKGGVTRLDPPTWYTQHANVELIAKACRAPIYFGDSAGDLVIRAVSGTAFASFVTNTAKDCFHVYKAPAEGHVLLGLTWTAEGIPVATPLCVEASASLSVGQLYAVLEETLARFFTGNGARVKKTMSELLFDEKAQPHFMSSSSEYTQRRFSTEPPSVNSACRLGCQRGLCVSVCQGSSHAAELTMQCGTCGDTTVCSSCASFCHLGHELHPVKGMAVLQGCGCDSRPNGCLVCHYPASRDDDTARAVIVKRNTQWRFSRANQQLTQVLGNTFLINQLVSDVVSFDSGQFPILEDLRRPTMFGVSVKSGKQLTIWTDVTIVPITERCCVLAFSLRDGTHVSSTDGPGSYGAPDDRCLMLEVLPVDALARICCMLPLKDASALTLTCKTMAEMRTWDQMWRKIGRSVNSGMVEVAETLGGDFAFHRMSLATRLATRAPHSLNTRYIPGVAPYACYDTNKTFTVRGSTAFVWKGILYTLEITNRGACVFATKPSSTRKLWSTNLSFSDVTMEASLYAICDVDERASELFLVGIKESELVVHSISGGRFISRMIMRDGCRLVSDAVHMVGKKLFVLAQKPIMIPTETDTMDDGEAGDEGDDEGDLPPLMVDSDVDDDMPELVFTDEDTQPSKRKPTPSSNKPPPLIDERIDQDQAAAASQQQKQTPKPKQKQKQKQKRERTKKQKRTSDVFDVVVLCFEMEAGGTLKKLGEVQVEQGARIITNCAFLGRFCAVRTGPWTVVDLTSDNVFGRAAGPLQAELLMDASGDPLLCCLGSDPRLISFSRERYSLPVPSNRPGECPVVCASHAASGLLYCGWCSPEGAHLCCIDSRRGVRLWTLPLVCEEDDQASSDGPLHTQMRHVGSIAVFDSNVVVFGRCREEELVLAHVNTSNALQPRVDGLRLFSEFPLASEVASARVMVDCAESGERTKLYLLFPGVAIASFSTTGARQRLQDLAGDMPAFLFNMLNQQFGLGGFMGDEEEDEDDEGRRWCVHCQAYHDE